MLNEYGKILLQQIEQQRQQRLRQRAEERGLPIPSEAQQGSVTAAPLTQVACASSEFVPPSGSRGSSEPPVKAQPEKANTVIQQAAAQHNVDLANAMQSLINIAPLLVHRVPPQTAPTDGIIPTPCIPSVVSAPLMNQQPVILQPTALLHPSVYSMNPQQLQQPSKNLGNDFQTACAIREYDVSSSHIPLSFSGAPSSSTKVGDPAVATGGEVPRTEQAYDTVKPPQFGPLIGATDVDISHQRVQTAKKRYQEDLLRQMKEREAQREEEKARRRREDEEELIRLSKEIEQERLEKEEEEARQLCKSKQLAAANVAAAGSPKQQRSHQLQNYSLENAINESNRQAPARTRLLLRGEEFSQPQQESTLKHGDSSFSQFFNDTVAETSGSCFDKPGRRMRGAGAEAEQLLISDLERLKAELRAQIEEMRCLQFQQRQVLQQVNQENALRNSCNGCCKQKWTPNAVDGPASSLSGHPWAMSVPTQTSIEQPTLRNQCAQIRLALKNAGVTDLDHLVLRLAESTAAPTGYDAASRDTILFKQDTGEINPAAYNALAPRARLASVKEDGTLKVHHCNPVENSFSHGMQKDSGRSFQMDAASFSRQSTKDKCSNDKRKGSSIGDPEERPLPTLLKLQQQGERDQRDAVLQQQCTKIQQVDRHLKGNTGAPNHEPHPDSQEIDTGCKRHEQQPLQCMTVKETHVCNTPESPPGRKWQLNKLWARLSQSVPPPAQNHPRRRRPDGEDNYVWSLSSSWCTSDCESELPCQTVFLPYDSGLSKSPKELEQSQKHLPRGIDTMAKNGWLPASQMESLGISTVQTATPEECSRLTKPAQDFCMTRLLMLNECHSYKGNRAQQENAGTPVNMGDQASRPNPFLLYREAQPTVPITNTDCGSSMNTMEEGLFCGTDYRQLCRALSVNSAPLHLQHLHKLDCQIRQQYNACLSPKERSFRHLHAIANQQRVYENCRRGASQQRAKERFKSRLSWEADTAFPVDEGSPALSHVVQRQVHTFGPRPFAPLLERPLAFATDHGDGSNRTGNPESFKPTPSKPPNKHVPPPPNHSQSLSLSTSTKKRTRLSRVLGGMLLRNSSKLRQ
ncbi:hypothetical protein cyc_03562 [Cyclospora cayetanensis]|uniref:Uncharacterized protein n=1 Tax=Cyclospora cayetanensis TaxID=88456 RepID=A0A1D3CW31_9EIME|nr:hypothetical protein cyc_03562 [Cyclospora cayetanensis]